MSHVQRLASTIIVGAAVVAILSVATATGNKPPEAADVPVQQTPDAPEDKPAKPADDAEKKDLYHFMRKKLEASGKVLEGLAVEDFDLIKEGAKELNTLSMAEKFRVSNDPLYRNFSQEFQRLTKDLMQSAEDENLDRAALKWMDATLSCIECHRFTRGILIAGNIP